MLVHALRAAGLRSRLARSAASIGEGLANAQLERGGGVAGRRGRRVRPLDAERCTSRSRCSRTSSSTTTRRSARWPSCARRSARSSRGARTAIVVWDRPELLALRRAAPGGRARVRSARRGGVGRRTGRARSRLRRARAVAHEGRCALRLARRTRCTLAVPGAHNALNAAAALEAARLAGAEAQVRSRASPASTARAGAFSCSARARAGRACTTTTPTTRPRSRRRSRAARTLAHERLVAVFQPHLYSRTALLAREFGAGAGARRRGGRARRLPRARARGGPPRRQRPADRRGRRRRGGGAGRCTGCPRSPDAEPVLRGLLSAGDVCVVMGAGDVDALARAAGGERRWRVSPRRRDSPTTDAVDRPARLPARAPGDRAHGRRRPSSSRAPAARRSCASCSPGRAPRNCRWRSSARARTC